MEMPDSYALFDHTMLTVEEERSLFCDWCEFLAYARDTDEITMKEYFEYRAHLERWYARIGNERDAAYMERNGIVQLPLFAANA